MVRETGTQCDRALFSQRRWQRLVEELKRSGEPQFLSALAIQPEGCGTASENGGVPS